MKTLSADVPVGDIVARFPASVRVFEKHGIDFCCGGSVTVGDACHSRGLDAFALLREVEQAGEPAGADSTDWQSASLGDLIDHIVDTHHGYLKTELPRVQGMLEKVLRAHSERHSDVLKPLAASFYPLQEELDAHMMKEERILFPMIRGLETGQPGHFPFRGAIESPIHVMMHEHDSAGRSLEAMREVTSNYTPPADACNTYRALYQALDELERDLHLHIHLENNILFPRATNLEAANA
ncbi:MAG TPA: iron-sulfur cluster repair di-iron protein [Bryobacteraceae bacterium]|nr:iron-sulfur cluster repair di-iron protein [Bryobacteraceae bacterium]